MPLIQSVEEVLAGEEARAAELSYMEEIPEVEYSALASFVTGVFTTNDNARRSSGVEREILDSQRAYRGRYSSKDWERLKREGGSRIWMNLTAIKCRNALSWITDVFLPAKGFIFSIEPTPNPELPADIRQNITQSIEREFSEDVQKQQQPDEQGQPQQPTLEQAQQSISAINQKRRDISKKIDSEIMAEAKFQLCKQERQIADQFAEGGFNKAFTAFLTDFVVAPTAFLKGPVITPKKRMVWEGGRPVVKTELISIDERVDPIDMYPSPGAKSIQEGNLCEHIRIDPLVLEGYKDLTEEGYDSAKVQEILEEGPSIPGWLPSSEEEVDDLKDQGETTTASENLFHGIHYHGCAKVEDLKEWGLTEGVAEDAVYTEVEILLINNEVIKAVVNTDPLNRRPYHSACYMNRPGSIWGGSLPMAMEPDQRMCNATARSISNNLALSSGPQVGVNIDLLADDGPIEELSPRKIWQFISDPTGSSRKAIEFFSVPSNVQELLKVYEFYESKADDATGIPRYAYSNAEKANFANSPNALAMLLESSSKTIRNCIRNIDTDVVIPRVQQQFYINTLQNPTEFSGDIQIIAKGSQALSVRGAQILRRNEFLNSTANPIDQRIMGVEFRADIIRTQADELGVDIGNFPDSLDLKRQLAEDAENAKAERESAMQQRTAPAQMQIEGQKEMHQGTQQVKIAELKTKAQIEARKLEIREAEVMQQNAKENQRNTVDLERTNIAERGKDGRAVREIALKLKTGSGI